MQIKFEEYLSVMRLFFHNLGFYAYLVLFN